MLTVTWFGNKFPAMGIMLKYERFGKTRIVGGLSRADGTAGTNSASAGYLLR